MVLSEMTKQDQCGQAQCLLLVWSPGHEMKWSRVRTGWVGPHAGMYMEEVGSIPMVIPEQLFTQQPIKCGEGGKMGECSVCRLLRPMKSFGLVLTRHHR